MPRQPLSLDAVRELALALPGVEESTLYGAKSWKVRGKLVACQAINKSAEPNSLVVKIPFEQRDELIAAQPDVYYVTDHYVNYPSVVVRLSRSILTRYEICLAWQLASWARRRRNRDLEGARRLRRLVAELRRPLFESPVWNRPPAPVSKSSVIPSLDKHRWRPMLELRNVSKRFAGSLAVDHVSFARARAK